MQILKSQTWELKNEDEITTIEFDHFKDEVEMTVHQGDKMVVLNQEQIKELKNILDYTKYIFNQ